MDFILKKLNELEKLIMTHGISKKEILTVDEAANILDLSKSAIYKMTSNGIIPCYRPNGKKLYFKRSELEEWIFNNKVETDSKIEKEIQLYLGKGKISIP